MAAAEARRTLTGVRGFEPPSWQAVAEGLRPVFLLLDEYEPGGVRQGWQHEAHPERKRFSETTSSTPCQTGIGHSSVPKLDLELVSLCEWHPRTASPRLSLICSVLSFFGDFGCLSLSVRSCRCGRAIDIFGHPCSLLKGRGSGAPGFRTGERSGADLQGGGRSGSVSISCVTYVPVLAQTTDDWKWWLMVYSSVEGASSQQTRRSCAPCTVMVLRTKGPQSAMDLSPELVGPRSRARLVVLAMEVGGRQLAKARCRREVPLLRKRVGQAWRLRWGAILGCAVARAVAASLLELWVLLALTVSARQVMRWLVTTAMMVSLFEGTLRF